ncbi:hypothetical protein GNF77_17690 [Clostridium perfringens]|uniref:Uncharacterized protein n=1 Tax=Clostridium perfringens TaxID=1502 RepID=A0AAW9IWT8_CLOPF|nr:hypothetical protein [Clostridium perfringens]
MKIKLNKDTIRVTIRGYEDEMTNVTPDNIKATLDVSSFKEDGTFEQTPKVTLQELNNNFSIVSFENATFTVSKEVAQKPPENNNNSENN